MGGWDQVAEADNGNAIYEPDDTLASPSNRPEDRPDGTVHAKFLAQQHLTMKQDPRYKTFGDEGGNLISRHRYHRNARLETSGTTRSWGKEGRGKRQRRHYSTAQ